MPSKLRQMRLRVRQVGELGTQLLEARRDVLGQHAMRDRDAVRRRRRQPQRQRRTVRARHVTRGDLRKIVILGLQPEDRDDGLARFRRQGSRDADGGGRLVDGEQRSQEEADLLPGDHGGGAAPQRREMRVARGAGREARVLRGERVGDGRRERAHGAQHRATPVRRIRVVSAEEGARAARQVRLKDSAHRDRSR